MADPRFVGLVHSLLASAQAVLGEEHSPMGRHLERDGVRSRRTAQRSLALLEMLLVKTQGNLDETERAALADALRWIRERTEDAGDDGAQALPMAAPPREPN
jgi:hypothetical protein